MAKLVLLLLAFLALSEAAPSAKPLDMTKIRPMRRTRPVLESGLKGRIVGGDSAEPGLIPYQAMVFSDDIALFGGTLISPTFILTSGQAIDGYSSWTVTLGATTLSSSSETWRIVQQSFSAVLHPSYLSGANIGLIQLPTTVTENTYISRALLPAPEDVGNAYIGAIGRASGFGITSLGTVADTLQYIDVTVISNADCSLIYGGTISEDDICASSPVGNTCAGDNGGPLALYYGDGIYKVIGVSSFGGPTGCSPTIPGGYSRVTSYLTWIQSITGLRNN